MRPLEAVKKYFREQVRKAFDPVANIDLNKVVGWHSVGGSNAYGFYRDNQYENGYSSISKLANGFAQIEPETIDKNGESIASNVLDRLYTPNTDMSAYDFREALAVTTLVHDRVRIRVHHTGTRINADSITGFTFMEGYSERIVDGKRTYTMPNGNQYTDDEVITLKSVNPESVTDGFSPSRAARRWTKLDDYMADYQRGFFENGAVPAGEMIITARTKAEFNDIVDMLQAKHQGASNNNNITYVHRPTDQNGQPLNAQIEWIPFSVNNKELALKDLFENVNKKIDSVYGVPQEIRGHLANSNYASVAVAERVFVKYALNPMTLKIWSKFTHELNRITGGMGLAISYDLEVPQIADEEKVKAEARTADAATITALVSQGFTLESVVEYINTGEPYALVIGTVPTKDKPEVLSPEEAKDTPEQPIDIYSKTLKRVVSKQPLPIESGCTRCDCCKGLGEHYDTGYECYRCDASGSVTKTEAQEPIPCGGRADSSELWVDEQGDYRHAEEKKAIKSLKLKQVAARQLAGLYDDLQVDPAMVADESLRGCIMLKTEALDVLSLVSDSVSDLANDVVMDRSPVPGETSPHVTLLFGLLNNGNTWRDKVDLVLNGWQSNTITIEEVGFFTLPDSYAIIAHVKKTTDLIEANQRLSLLPNAQTFSEYRPHITLAYIKKEADLGKWVKALGEAYDGVELNTNGLDYGDLPTESKSVSKKLSEVDQTLYEFQMKRIIHNQMSRQVDKAIGRLDEAIKNKAFGDMSEEEDIVFTSEMQNLLTPLMVIHGNRAINTATNLIVQAGLSTQDIKPFEFTPAQRKAYERYLAKVGTSYADQTAEQIRQVLGQAVLDGATKAEIESMLREVILGPNNEYRVVRLARTEVNLSEGRASVYAMENVQEQTGFKIYKVWNTSGADPCPFCQEMDGTETLVDEMFVPLGEEVRAGDQVFTNNWTGIESAELHANCNCYTTYRVEAE